MTDVHLDRPSTPVSAVRHSRVVTIRECDTLWDAWQLMFVSGMRHLAVVDERGGSVGLLSDRAILTELPLTEEHLAGRHVSTVMSIPGHVTEDSSAQQAASRMARHAVDALPIVADSGRPIALLTAGDLVDWVARD
jgi:CBS domain-containing protein